MGSLGVLTAHRQGLHSVLRDDSVRPAEERRKSRWTGLRVGPWCGHHGRLLERAYKMQREPDTCPQTVRCSVTGNFVQNIPIAYIRWRRKNMLEKGLNN